MAAISTGINLSYTTSSVREELLSWTGAMSVSIDACVVISGLAFGVFVRQRLWLGVAGVTILFLVCGTQSYQSSMGYFEILRTLISYLP